MTLLPEIYRLSTDDSIAKAYRLAIKFVLIDRLRRLILTPIAATVCQA